MRMLWIFSASIFLAHLLTGCAISQIEAPSDMTVEEAKSIIREYVEEDMKVRRYDVSEVIVEDTYFTDVKENDLSLENRIIKYEDIGDIQIRLARGPYISFLIFSPYVLRAKESRGLVSSREVLSPMWTQLIPFWLLGTPLWYKSDTEEYLEALAFMRDHSKRQAFRKSLEETWEEEKDTPQEPKITPEEPMIEEPVETPPEGEEDKEETPELPDQQPIELTCDLQGETTAKIGEQVALTCQIRNTGKAESDIYQLQITVSPGLTYQTGDESSTENAASQKKNIVMQNLAPGKEESFAFSVVSEKAGQHKVTIALQKEQQVLCQDELSIEVLAPPKLLLTMQAPERLYQQRELEYSLVVRNEGEKAITPVTLHCKLDNKANYLSATPSGQYDQNARVVSWELGELSPGAKQNVSLKMRVPEGQRVEGKSLVKLGEELLAGQKVITHLYKATGLQITHSDNEDPIDAGAEMTYQIEILNRGPSEASSIEIFDQLPEGAEFVSAAVSGTDFTINYNVQGRKILFDPIPKLAADQALVIKILVRMLTAGDQVNTLKVKSQDFNKILTSQEPTTVIGKQQDTLASPGNNVTPTTPKQETPASGTTLNGGISMEALEESLLDEENFIEEGMETSEPPKEEENKKPEQSEENFFEESIVEPEVMEGN